MESHKGTAAEQGYRCPAPGQAAAALSPLGTAVAWGVGGKCPDAVPCSPASSAKVAQSTPALPLPEHCSEGRSQKRPLGAQRASVLLQPETRLREESVLPSATNGTLLQTCMKICLSGSWGARSWVLSGPRNWQRPSARSGWGKDGALHGLGSSEGPLHSCWGPLTPSATRPFPDSITLSALSRAVLCLQWWGPPNFHLPCGLAPDSDAAVQLGTGS